MQLSDILPPQIMDALKEELENHLAEKRKVILQLAEQSVDFGDNLDIKIANIAMVLKTLGHDPVALAICFSEAVYMLAEEMKKNKENGANPE